MSVDHMFLSGCLEQVRTHVVRRIPNKLICFSKRRRYCVRRRCGKVQSLTMNFPMQCVGGSSQSKEYSQRNSALSRASRRSWQSAWCLSLAGPSLTAPRTVSFDLALALPPTLRSVLYWYTRVANFGMFDWTTDDTIGMGWQNFDKPNTPSDTL
jgi:hypothetical protein